MPDIQNLEYFKGKHVLITGAGGYIGASLAKALSTVDCTLTLLSRSGNAADSLKNTTAKVKAVSGDITDQDVWKNILESVDIVFHLAAQTSSRSANNDPIADLETNVLPVLRLIDACVQYDLSPDIIYAGAVTETGITESGKTAEDHQDLPVTIYDIHKLTAEKYLQYYSNQMGKRAVTLRLPNIYGPGPASSQPDRGITNMMVKKALQGESLTVFGDGSYVRDYLFIDDVVAAFLAAAAHIEKTRGKYYVLGTGVGHSIGEMAGMIAAEVEKTSGKKVSVGKAEFPEGTSPIEYRSFTADPSLFNMDTGWMAATSLEDGIKKTVHYFSHDS